MDQETKEASQAKTKSQQDVKLEVVEQPNGIYYGYANHIVLSYTAHDVVVRFSQLARLPEIGPSDPPTSKVEQRAAISMAWSEAKALRDLLSQLIQKFEDVNKTSINAEPKIP